MSRVSTPRSTHPSGNGQTPPSWPNIPAPLTVEANNAEKVPEKLRETLEKEGMTDFCYTAWMSTEEDQRVSEGRRRKEIERASTDLKESLPAGEETRRSARSE